MVAFKQIVLCRKKGLQNAEIAFAVNMSIRRVEEYRRLIEDFARHNPSFERNLAARLDELLKNRKEDATWEAENAGSIGYLPSIRYCTFLASKYEGAYRSSSTSDFEFC